MITLILTFSRVFCAFYSPKGRITASYINNISNEISQVNNSILTFSEHTQTPIACYSLHHGCPSAIPDFAILLDSPSICQPIFSAIRNHKNYYNISPNMNQIPLYHQYSVQLLILAHNFRILVHYIQFHMHNHQFLSLNCNISQIVTFMIAQTRTQHIE